MVLMNLKNNYPWLFVSTHTSPTRGFGGPSVSFRSLISQISRRGKIYELITTYPYYKQNPSKIKNEYYYKTFIFHKIGFSIKALFSIIYRYRNTKVVFINGLTTFINFNTIFLFSFSSNTKVVIFPRGGLEYGRTNSWNILKKFFFNFQLRLIKNINNSNRLMVVFATQSELSKSTLLSSNNNCILPNINSDLFIDKNINESRKFDLIYVGRFSPEKGIDRLENILKLINKNPVISICIVFDSISPIDFKILKSKYKSLNIHWHVGVANDEVHKMMRSSKYLFFPSYVENYGNVLVEAVSQGAIPIVYPDTHWRALLGKYAIDEITIFKMIEAGKVMWNKDLSINSRKFIFDNYVKNDSLNTIFNWIEK